FIWQMRVAEVRLPAEGFPALPLPSCTLELGLSARGRGEHTEVYSYGRIDFGRLAGNGSFAAQPYPRLEEAPGGANGGGSSLVGKCFQLLSKAIGPRDRLALSGPSGPGESRHGGPLSSED